MKFFYNREVCISYKTFYYYFAFHTNKIEYSILLKNQNEKIIKANCERAD